MFIKLIHTHSRVLFSFNSYLPQAKLLNKSDVRMQKNVGFRDLSLVLTLYSTPLTDNFLNIKLFMIITFLA